MWDNLTNSQTQYVRKYLSRYVLNNITSAKMFGVCSILLYVVIEFLSFVQNCRKTWRALNEWYLILGVLISQTAVGFMSFPNFGTNVPYIMVIVAGQ